MKFLPAVLTRNWQLKLSAFAMSILLWTVPRFEAQETRVFETVPIQIEYRESEWALVGVQPGTADVTVSGTARELLGLSLERPLVSVPVDSVVEGETSIRLRTTWFTSSGRDAVVVEGMSPEAVVVTFEPVEERSVVLAAPLIGTLPEGRSLSGPLRLDPVEVLVRGPASQVAALDTLFLMPVDLSRITGSGDFLQPVDSTALGDVRVTNPEVTVRLEVEETVHRSVPGLPIQVPSPASGVEFHLTPNTVTVELVGARSLVESVNPSDLLVTFPLAQALTLAPGQEMQVFPTVEGIPDLLVRDHNVRPQRVTLRRPAGL